MKIAREKNRISVHRWKQVTVRGTKKERKQSNWQWHTQAQWSIRNPDEPFRTAWDRRTESCPVADQPSPFCSLTFIGFYSFCFLNNWPHCCVGNDDGGLITSVEWTFLQTSSSGGSFVWSASIILQLLSEQALQACHVTSPLQML